MVDLYLQILQNIKMMSSMLETITALIAVSIALNLALILIAIRKQK